MTQADKHFIETCKEIIENGISSEGTNVRTRWEDGTEANYVSIIGVSNKYDVGKEFPMITLRNNSGTIKRAIDEVLWIWQKKSNNVKDGIKEMDQVDYVLYLLKNDQSSRRIVTNIFNHEELKDMGLEPCLFCTQWLVKQGKLHLILNQRSQDMLAANRMECNAICSITIYVRTSSRIRSRNTNTQYR